MIFTLIVCSLLLIFVIMGLYCNKNLKIKIYNLKSDRLPESFEGFRIAQVSDMHNCTYGKNNEKLLNMLKDSNPHIIVITGDMIDSRRTDIKTAADFANKAVRIAPCYYVSGNHEARMPDEYKALLNELRKAGVIPLQNSAVKIERANQSIILSGVEDPYITHQKTLEPNSGIMDRNITKAMAGTESEFTILLSHRPEHLSVYADHNIDLCLTGHTHGGQIRLPLIGGLFAPNQGFLPNLDAGMFKEKNTTMIISCGVGSSQFPLRFLNPPEIPVIILNRE